MKRILIVDDIEENLYLLRVLLQGHGFEVEEARNGSEAIVKAISAHPDMVISDILMPVIDGFTLCRIWKADENLKKAPFIFYTATYTDPRDEQLALDMGADAFIVKPAEPDEFLRQIETVLARVSENMLTSPQEPKDGNDSILKHYNETLVRKLEKKMLDLEGANRELEELNQELEYEITEKNVIEAKLRESEELFRNIFHQHVAVKIIVDPETGNIIDANEAAANFYGWPVEQLVKMKVQDFNILTSAEIKAAMEMVVNQEQVCFEFKHRKADGSLRDVEVFSSRIKVQGKDLLHSIIHDITDRKRAEEALRESERLFHLITENMTDTIWMMDMNFGYTFVSPSLLKNRGYTFEEMKNLPMDRLLTPESNSLAMSIIAEEMAPGRLAQKDLAISRTFALENYRKDGSTFWSEITMTILRDPAGTPIGILGLGRDITDRKRAEDSLRETTILLNTLLNAIPTPVYYKDMEGRYIGFNRSFEEFFGKPLKDLVGKTVFDITQTELADIYHKKDVELFQNPGKQVYDSQLKDARGVAHEVVFHKATFTDSGGTVRGLIGVILDITENKRAQKRLEELYSNLEKIVAERTAELEKANQELESYSYTVSHDLRAPLRHINGFLEMFRREMGDLTSDKAKHYMDIINESANRMGMLIDDLLAFSRMGKVDLTIAPVNMETMVDEVLNDFQNDIAQNSIAVSRAPLPPVMGDRAMIRVVLTNLISNAVKFTAKTVNPTIDITCETKGGEHIYSVRDNGAGFDMRFANKLFGVFQRLHNERDFEGTGIGLATVRNIIQRHGGMAWAEGEVGRGARFYFSLPAAPIDPPEV